MDHWSDLPARQPGVRQPLPTSRRGLKASNHAYEAPQTDCPAASWAPRRTTHSWG